MIKLEQNYRSTQNILDAANAVIANNARRKSKALWTDRGAGNRVHFRAFDTAYEEAEYIAGDIKRKKRELVSDYRDCAVLYRTNAQSRLLEESFIALNIPYNVVGGVNFYARREIKDILAYLKTIDNGRDDLAVKRIINVPKRGIGASSIAKVQDYADHMGMSFCEALQQVDEIPALGKGKSADKLRDFATMIRMFRTKQQNGSLEDLITDVIETTGYVRELEESGEEDAKDRIENIDELITKIVSFEMEREELGEEAALSAFLEEVALVADIDSVDKDGNRVLLMTLHSAKGLEYFCTEDDDFWNMTDKEFTRLGIKEMVKMGLIDNKRLVLDAHAERVKKAYPAYFDTYEEIDKLIAYINTIDNLYCVGRNGQHRYNNIDHSMMTSFETVNNILSGKKDKSNIWNVNTEKEYHEQKEQR